MKIDPAEVEAALAPITRFSHDCHAGSLALVRTGLLGSEARVARGALMGVPGQHSWAVVGNPYHPEVIVDVTAWSYDVRRDGKRVPPVWITDASGGHTPKGGTGTIWQWGAPRCGDGESIHLAVEVSAEAEDFLRLVAEMSGRDGLDIRGWIALMGAPVAGWPAAEIVAAMGETSSLSPLIPVDLLGMLTDKNPGGLYR